MRVRVRVRSAALLGARALAWWAYAVAQDVGIARPGLVLLDRDRRSRAGELASARALWAVWAGARPRVGDRRDVRSGSPSPSIARPRGLHRSACSPAPDCSHHARAAHGVRVKLTQPACGVGHVLVEVALRNTVEEDDVVPAEIAGPTSRSLLRGPSTCSSRSRCETPSSNTTRTGRARGPRPRAVSGRAASAKRWQRAQSVARRAVRRRGGVRSARSVRGWCRERSSACGRGPGCRGAR